jgi:prepilin peptidase CpaA
MQFINDHHAVAALVLVVAASLAAAVFDVRTRKIPNALVLTLFAAGLALNAALGVRYAALDAAIALAVLLLGTGAFSLRLIGGGDVKLLAGAAGTLGWPAAGSLILLTVLCGGIIAVVLALAHGRLRATFENVRGIAMPIFAGVAPSRLQSGTSMPYALAICAGALLTLVTSGLVPHMRLSWLPQ